MQKLLFRRTLRDMKTNFFRYMALLLLIILCMFIVVGTIGSAVSVIKTVNNKAEAARLEDGQFRVFVPLTETSLRNLENKGILLEECFHLDFLMEDGSTLRIMKNRETINLAELSEGSLAHAPGEIVVERLGLSHRGEGALPEDVADSGMFFTHSNALPPFYCSMPVAA